MVDGIGNSYTRRCKMNKITVYLFALVFVFGILDAKKINAKNEIGIFDTYIDKLSDDLVKNSFSNESASNMAVTSFVRLDDFKATSRISNILSENLVHKMQKRGFKIVDFKTMKNITVNPSGDFVFSRDISKLHTDLSVEYVITGTYIEYRTGMVVNARIINLTDHIILSTAQIFIPRHIVKSIALDKNQIIDFSPNKKIVSK
jgi:TolB-like protein